ncbi:MAG: molybdopterin-guanine dinucleotide biosynthesis protein B [Alphaproteobacteria bacterium]
MRTFGLAGWEGSGKTTLMVKLVKELTDRGFTVSSMNHVAPGCDIDRPGKDSYRHRAAGAAEVVVTSTNRWALLHELHGAPGPAVEDLEPHLTPVDLLLVEGARRDGHPKVEVHRPSAGRPLLCRDDPRIVAVASDAPLSGVDVPVLDLDDTAAVADFIVGYCDLEAG